MRIKIFRVIIILSFLTVAMTLFYVQVFQGRHFYDLSKNNRIRVVPLEGWRGKISDRNGVLLADNEISYDLLLLPQELKESDDLFVFLNKTLDVDLKVLKRRYLIRKLTPFTPVILAENITKEQAIILEENKFQYPGLFVEESFKRQYPLGEDFAHVLGYVGKVDSKKREKYKEYGYSPQRIVGHTGIEEYYDEYLKGGEGGYQIEVNSRGRKVRLLSLKEPTPGEDIEISLDSRIQQIAAELMEEKMGSIIVMDLNNGEILSMVSSPSYDPNLFLSSKKRKQLSSLFSQKDAPFFNRATKGLFPPGSVFKVPLAICALDKGKIEENTRFFCDGKYKLGRTTFRCAHTHGSQNLIEALAHSCNIYFYHVGQKLGSDEIQSCVDQFGMGRITYIDLPYEKKGFIPHRQQNLVKRKRRWFPGDTLNLSIGQGDVLVTPLQMVQMMATVSNEGEEVQPHLIRKVGGEMVGRFLSKNQLKIDRDVFQTVKKGLRAAVVNYAGTAHVLDLKEVYVAGKTGTAQSSPGKEDHSWFVGYAKGVRNIAFSVMLEHGGSSRNACLVARQLLLKMHKFNLI